MKRWKEWLQDFRWQKLLIVWGVFLLIALVLFAERSGVTYSQVHFKVNYLAKEQTMPKKDALADEKKECLLIWNSESDVSAEAKEVFDAVMLDMKVGTRAVDLSAQELPNLAEYKTAVILLQTLDDLGDGLVDLMSWVEQGGSALFGVMPDKTGYLDVIAAKMGIQSSSWEYKMVESIVPSEGFMLGGGQRYELSDPYESAQSVALREEAKIYAETGDEGVPLIWANDAGKGRIVVDNIGVYERVLRGVYASSYSLLQSAAAWPVINSAVFYLDDFPSPVPGGDGKYIRRDYGLSIADFYARVWWPDIVQLAEKYGIHYTGVMIENYEDDTLSSPQRQSDSERFRYYGGLLLRQGGELGYHGYNHQPLVLPDTDYGNLYDYHQWPNADAITAAMNELIAFQEEVLPYAKGSVYVPPSNIMSAEGRKVLAETVPQIKTIASTYFEDGTSLPYVQEFDVAEDGIVEQPRIVSGGMVGNTYMHLAAFSELNFHFVSTHFMHPDDLLDKDRGAAEGWEVYKSGLEDYLSWLEEAAPDIRKQTGTECSGAVQRFSALTVSMQETEDSWQLGLGNFVDEAWLLFRANEGAPGRISGGTLTHLTGNLYLLKAENSTVTIERQGGESA